MLLEEGFKEELKLVLDNWNKLFPCENLSDCLKDIEGFNDILEKMVVKLSQHAGDVYFCNKLSRIKKNEN